MSSKVVQELDAIQLDQFSSDADRYAVREAARRLLARVESPFEQGWALALETPMLIAGLQIAFDLGIWEKWLALEKEQGAGVVQTLDQLVSLSNRTVEPNLLRRFMRHIASMHMLEETDVDTWKLGTFTRAMGDRSTFTWHLLTFGTEHSIPGGVNLPRFFPKHNYVEPLDPTKFDNYTDALGTGFFDLCQKDPVKGNSFNGLMTTLRNYKMDWTAVYDTKRFVEGADLSGSKPLFVDIGGMHGLDSSRLLARHEDLPGGLITVQDLPAVIAAPEIAALDSRIAKMDYDFFTPQPLKGSRAYFFHAVPHDWPDAEAVKILKNVADAMEKGYSRLLIYEIVLPAKGATNLMTTLDLQLMNVCSGLERTQAMWEKLIAEAGLKIVDISRHPRAIESVIEAELI